MVAACSHQLRTAITMDLLLCAVLHFGGNFTSKCTYISPCSLKRPLSSPFEGHKLLSLRERMGVGMCMCACKRVCVIVDSCVQMAAASSEAGLAQVHGEDAC
jgi:hypothetical protein